MRMRHPALDAVIEIPDDPDCIAAHAESGWVEAPEDTVQHHPALMPGEQLPVEHAEPIKAKRSRADSTETTD